MRIIQSGILLFLILGFVIITGGCMSSPPSETIADKAVEEEKKYQTWQDIRRPLSDQLELPPLPEVLLSDSSDTPWMPEELPFWVWMGRPAGDSPLFLGTSYPMGSRQDELDRCIEHAARQAAQYAGIAAIVSSFQGQLKEGSGFAEDTRLFYNQNLIPTLIAESELKTLHQDASGSYALVRFPSLRIVEMSLNWSDLEDGKDEPRWISSPPITDTDFFGLGIARKSMRFADSIAESDKDAVAEILSQLATTVDVAYDVSRDARGETSFAVDNYQYSTAMVRGIQIVARWRSPDGQYYYSLAVLPGKA